MELGLRWSADTASCGEDGLMCSIKQKTCRKLLMFMFHNAQCKSTYITDNIFAFKIQIKHHCLFIEISVNSNYFFWQHGSNYFNA